MYMYMYLSTYTFGYVIASNYSVCLQTSAIRNDNGIHSATTRITTIKCNSFGIKYLLLSYT